MDIRVPKLLGGVANGQDVPLDWQMISEWLVPGTDFKSYYEERAYFHGNDRFLVWTDVELPNDLFQAIIWHRETHRSELISSQKQFLHENNEAGKRYAEIITTIGFAGLFALWAQMKNEFNPTVSFISILLISISLILFVGWELFGMVFRSRINLATAKALHAPEAEVINLLSQNKEKMQLFVVRYSHAWGFVVAAAIFTGASSGIIMLAAIVYSAWDSI